MLKRCIAHDDSTLLNDAHCTDAVSTDAPAALNGAVVPDFSEDADHDDELLSDEDAPDLQDEIAKTLTSLRVSRLPFACCFMSHMQDISSAWILINSVMKDAVFLRFVQGSSPCGNVMCQTTCSQLQIISSKIGKAHT